MLPAIPHSLEASTAGPLTQTDWRQLLCLFGAMRNSMGPSILFG